MAYWATPPEVTVDPVRADVRRPRRRDGRNTRDDAYSCIEFAGNTSCSTRGPALPNIFAMTKMCVGTALLASTIRPSAVAELASVPKIDAGASEDGARPLPAPHPATRVPRSTAIAS